MNANARVGSSTKKYSSRRTINTSKHHPRHLELPTPGASCEALMRHGQTLRSKHENKRQGWLQGAARCRCRNRRPSRRMRPPGPCGPRRACTRRAWEPPASSPPRAPRGQRRLCLIPKLALAAYFKLRRRSSTKPRLSGKRRLDFPLESTLSAIICITPNLDHARRTASR